MSLDVRQLEARPVNQSSRHFSLAALLLFAGCRPPWDHFPQVTQVAPNYTFTTSSPGCTFLDRGGHIILGPHIANWELRGKLLFGEVAFHSDQSPDLTTPREDMGFFIVDTESGELSKGLQKSAFDERRKCLERHP